MPCLVDEAAKEIALRRWVLPECLHVPVAAVDETAIRDYVGDIEQVLSRGSAGTAFLVNIPEPPTIDPLLPICDHPNASILYADLSDLMLMLDIKVGGGVMAAVNEGQQLVERRVYPEAVPRSASDKGLREIRAISVRKRSHFPHVASRSRRATGMRLIAPGATAIVPVLGLPTQHRASRCNSRQARL